MRHARQLLALSLLPAALALVLAGCGSNSGANKQEGGKALPELKIDPASTGGTKAGQKSTPGMKVDPAKPGVQ